MPSNKRKIELEPIVSNENQSSSSSKREKRPALQNVTNNSEIASRLDTSSQNSISKAIPAVIVLPPEIQIVAAIPLPIVEVASVVLVASEIAPVFAPEEIFAPVFHENNLTLPLSAWCTKMPKTDIETISSQVFSRVNDFQDANLDGLYYEIYSDEINSHFLKCEDYGIYDSNYVYVQKQISPNRRSLVLDAMIYLSNRLRMNQETLFLAMNIVERYFILCKHEIQFSKLLLSGMSALLIASKYSERDRICHNDILNAVKQNPYTKQNLILQENEILKVIDWDITVPTVCYFLQRYLVAAELQSNKLICKLVHCICERAYLDYRCTRFRPSVIAASALKFARVILKERMLSYNDPAALDLTSWSKTLKLSSGYDEMDFMECLETMQLSFCEEVQGRNKIESNILTELEAVIAARTRARAASLAISHTVMNANATKTTEPSVPISLTSVDLRLPMSSCVKEEAVAAEEPDIAVHIVETEATESKEPSRRTSMTLRSSISKGTQACQAVLKKATKKISVVFSYNKSKEEPAAPAPVAAGTRSRSVGGKGSVFTDNSLESSSTAATTGVGRKRQASSSTSATTSQADDKAGGDVTSTVSASNRPMKTSRTSTSGGGNGRSAPSFESSKQTSFSSSSTKRRTAGIGEIIINAESSSFAAYNAVLAKYSPEIYSLIISLNAVSSEEFHHGILKIMSSLED